MRDAAYDAAIIKAFGYPSLRTAFVIDDQFPSYAELVKGVGEDKPKTETERAGELYSFFHEHKIPCDIANWSGEFDDSDIDRIRKTDLIVLDYNLGGDDIEKSLSIMRKLSESSHFNTIVVYTQSDNLDVVWDQIAAFMRGGWRSADELVDGNDLAGLWDENAELLLREDYDRTVTDSMMTGRCSDAFKEAKKEHLKRFREAGIAADKCNALFDIAVQQKIRERFGANTHLAEWDKMTIDGACEGAARWVQSGQCFIAIMGKKKPGSDDTTPGRIEVSEIFDCLNDALKSWCPNILQIILAEIQNVLELNALATARLHLNDKSMQLGLAYYLLWSMSEGVKGTDDSAALPALHMTIDKLVETIRFRVANEPDLVDTAKTVLSSELVRAGWTTNAAGDLPRTFEAACALARIETKHDEIETLFKLNEFLASEQFRRDHPTTGTVLHDEAAGEFIMCASPACDMVSRTPKQGWLGSMHPLRPLVGVHLDSSESVSSAIQKAELGRYVFFKLDGKMVVLSMMSKEQPVTEFFFVDYETGIFREQDSTYVDAFRLTRVQEEGGRHAGVLKPVRFRVVNQVRDTYASRFLQMTGNHLSRIGVDFVNFAPPEPNPPRSGKKTAPN